MSVNHICDEEINRLNEEVIVLTTKSRNLKKIYMEVLIENAQKDLIIRELKEQIMKQRFRSFEGKLSADCLNRIKLVDDVQKEDNSFIYFILKDIYGDSLKEKTLSGQTSARKNVDKNTAISPKIKLLLSNVFEERLQHMPMGERDSRRNKMNTLIRNAIDREKKAKKKQVRIKKRKS